MDKNQINEQVDLLVRAGFSKFEAKELVKKKNKDQYYRNLKAEIDDALNKNKELKAALFDIIKRYQGKSDLDAYDTCFEDTIEPVFHRWLDQEILYPDTGYD